MPRDYLFDTTFGRVPERDPRFAQLLRLVLTSPHGEQPRWDREYTKGELDAASFLVCRQKTVGLYDSPLDNLQAFDRSRACPTCSAGAKPRPPLAISTGRMGRKLMERTILGGWLVVTTDVGLKLKDSGLTGFRLQPVRGATSATSSPDWLWLDIEYEWPAVSVSRFLHRCDPCPGCGRAGHADCWTRPVVHVFDRFPPDVPDFSLSFEYFGPWFQRTPGDCPELLGGHQELILSQRARRELLRCGVRRLEFSPLRTSDDPLLKTWPMYPER